MWGCEYVFMYVCVSGRLCVCVDIYVCVVSECCVWTCAYAFQLSEKCTNKPRKVTVLYYIFFISSVCIFLTKNWFKGKTLANVPEYKNEAIKAGQNACELTLLLPMIGPC